MSEAAARPSVRHPRSSSLAIAFQEPLTTVLRVKTVNNDSFRASILKALKKSLERGRIMGYAEDDLQSAQFAVVAFLDEAVLYSGNPGLADWTPLQNELFRTGDAGELFYERLELILKKGNSPEVADLLEVYALCLYLGFRGEHRLKYEKKDQKNGEPDIPLPPVVDSVINKISRIRKDLPSKRPWALPDDSPPLKSKDVWFRRLLLTAFACLAGTIALWFLFNASIEDQLRAIRANAIFSGR